MFYFFTFTKMKYFVPIHVYFEANKKLNYFTRSVMNRFCLE